MSSSFIKLNHFVPLLTDTLPYEVPFLFSNAGFYESLRISYNENFVDSAVKKAKGEDIASTDINLETFFFEKYFDKAPALQEKIKALRTTYTKPFVYLARKNDAGFRKISLINPVIQVQFCALYKNHQEAILYNCSKSNYSLRYPHRLTKKVVKKHDKLLNKIFTEEEEANTSDIQKNTIIDHRPIGPGQVPSQYFVYEKYRQLHKFYDSPEFLDLEKKFKVLLKLDIKRCFDSIYTHSLSWAARGKDYTKENLKLVKKGKIFEHSFDDLMQRSNYNETNGILIGSEVSRIFAEIILQEIDLKIQNQIEQKLQKKNAIDYKLSRYVDDYFIFTNDLSLSEKIYAICSESLQEYKLFLNDEKSHSLNRPFLTKISAAKLKICSSLEAFLSSFHSGSGNEIFDKPANKTMRVNSHLGDIRSALSENDVSVYDIANIYLGIIKKDLLNNLKEIESLNKVQLDSKLAIIKNYLSKIVRVSFYIFRLSPRSHTCSNIFKISYIILEIAEKINDNEIRSLIEQDIFMESVSFCESVSSHSDEGMIEFLDIISLLERLQKNFALDSYQLKKFFPSLRDDSSEESLLSYFEIMVLLSYVKEKKQYSDIRVSLKSKALKLVKKSACLSNTETFLMVFDLIKCPYLDEDDKKSFLKAININKSIKIESNFIQSKNWFFNWEQEQKLNLKEVLTIKESHTGY